jgi:hypothetical protein
LVRQATNQLQIRITSPFIRVKKKTQTLVGV